MHSITQAANSLALISGGINCFRLAPAIDDDGFIVAESGRSCSISPRNRAS
jgi:hypothetical protein